MTMTMLVLQQQLYRPPLGLDFRVTHGRRVYEHIGLGALLIARQVVDNHIVILAGVEVVVVRVRCPIIRMMRHG